jgi:hypothetical protein
MYKAAALLALLLPSLAHAQTTQPAIPATAQPAHKREYPAPTNLQVLPKTLTGQQVHDLMEQWEQQTGMKCGTCHASDPTKLGPNGKPMRNYPDDSKNEKQSARIMYQMMEEINAKWLTRSTEFGDHVDCGTCHRGHQTPLAFVPEPHADHDHAAPAVIPVNPPNPNK